MPADTAAAHAAVTTAIPGSTVPRARAEEAAAKVVALQRRQARRAAATPVPDDAAPGAVAASRALSAAAVTQVGGPARRPRCAPSGWSAARLPVRVVGAAATC